MHLPAVAAILGRLHLPQHIASVGHAPVRHHLIVCKSGYLQLGHQHARRVIDEHPVTALAESE